MAETGIDRYDALHAGFRWQVPARFNIARSAARAGRARRPRRSPSATSARTARGATTATPSSDRAADRLAAALRSLGVERGDRVAIVMPQRFETAVAHIALYRLGAVAMPLSMLFGPDALEYRINDSGARLALVDETGIDNVLEAGRSARSSRPWSRSAAPKAAATPTGARCWRRGRGTDAGRHRRRRGLRPHLHQRHDRPAKGALLPHRVLIGNLPGFVCSQNWFPQDDAVFWSPADWAWTGGLMDALLPTLYFGREIVAYQGRFAPETAFSCWRRTGSRTASSFPPRSRR
jgi:acetyl-CoA synthetase